MASFTTIVKVCVLVTAAMLSAASAITSLVSLSGHKSSTGMNITDHTQPLRFSSASLKGIDHDTTPPPYPIVNFHIKAGEPMEKLQKRLYLLRHDELARQRAFSEQASANSHLTQESVQRHQDDLMELLDLAEENNIITAELTPNKAPGIPVAGSGRPW